MQELIRPSSHVEPYHYQTAEDVESRSMRMLPLNETGSLLAMGHSTLARVCPRIHPVCIATLRITGWRFFAMLNDIELGAATLKTAIMTVHVCQFSLFLCPTPTYSVLGRRSRDYASCRLQLWCRRRCAAAECDHGSDDASLDRRG
jgi:hypothetical protein